MDMPDHQQRTTRPSRRSQLSVEELRSLGRFILVRRIVTACCVCASAALQAFTIQAFINPADLLSGGFTGLAILIDRVTSLMGLSFPTSIGVLALNIPVALICWRSISKRFVLFSMAQVFLLSFFLNVFDAKPLLDDTLLNVIFGGVLMGTSIAIALKGGASTAGTDFIALFVSNRTGKTIWTEVLIGNYLMFIIFGAIFGWEHAAYTMVFQFIATKTIDGFYNRYKRSTLLITTQRGDELVPALTSAFHHGLARIPAQGGYSSEAYELLHTVVSAYEERDVVHFIRNIDPRAVVNVVKTEDFIGNFRRASIDEPLPTEVAKTPDDDPALEIAAHLRQQRANMKRYQEDVVTFRRRHRM